MKLHQKELWDQVKARRNVNDILTVSLITADFANKYFADISFSVNAPEIE